MLDPDLAVENGNGLADVLETHTRSPEGREHRPLGEADEGNGRETPRSIDAGHDPIAVHGRPSRRPANVALRPRAEGGCG